MKFMKKFLIIRFSSLGDIILTFAVLKNIKLNIPDAKIYYLTKEYFKEILEANPDVDKVITFKGLFKTISEINKERFDIVFDLHSNLRTLIIKKFIKHSRIVTYKKDSLARYLLILFKYISPKLEKHVIEKYLEVIKKVGLKIYTTDITIKDLKPREKNKDFKKILFFQTAFLGDLLLALPAIKTLRGYYKNSYIAIVVREENSKLFEGIKEIDEIIIDKKTSNKMKSTIQLIKKIREHKFDVAIISHRSIRSALICFLANIPIRVGFDIKPSSFFYNIRVPFKWSIHEVERNLMLVKTIVNEAQFSFPEIKSKKNLNLKTIIEEKTKIIINPSSVWNTKRWPPYKFAKLIEAINKKFSIKPILIGSEKEKAQLEAVTKLLPNDSFINLCSKTSLDELVELIKNANLLITNDSGPMHIAVACKTPVIALFGPTTKELGFFPYSENSIVLEEKVRCRPCRLHGSNKCPHKHFLCMKLIKIETVLNAVEKFLKY